MMHFLDTIVRFAIAVLANSLWQAPLFAIAAWLVLRVRPRANATTRHSVLAAALFASLILPVATASLASVHGNETGTRSAGEIRIPRGAVPYKPATTGASIPQTRIPEIGSPSTLTVSSLPALPLARLNLALPKWIALSIVGVWLAGAALALLRLSLSLGHLERLKRDALPVAVAYRERLTRWNGASKGARNVRLCVSDEIDIPIAVGLFDAMILIPKRLLEELEPHDIDSIVLHELAHLRRSDDWLNAVERLANAALYFNPAITWLSAQLDLEREVACDDWVLQQNDALPYATCLARVAETAVWPHRPMTAPGAFVTRRGMSIRIERLLAKHRDVRIRTSFGPAGSVVAVLAVLGIVAAFVSPSIAYSAAQTAAGETIAAVASTSPDAPRPLHEPVVMHPLHIAARPLPHPLVRAVPLVVPHVAATAAAVATAAALHAPSSAPLAPPASRAARSAPAPQGSPILHPFTLDTPEQAYVGNIKRSHHAARELRPDSSADAADDAATDAGSQADAAVDSDSGGGAGPAGVAGASAVAGGVGTIVVNALKEAAHATDRRQIVADANSHDYIDELRGVGYTNLSVDDLIKLRSVGVTADFIRELQRQGNDHPSVEDLVQLRAVGVEPSYVAAMRKRYGNDLSIGQMMGMKSVGVTPRYVDELSAAGLKDVSPERVTSLRTLGVSLAYIAGLARAGYTGLTTDQISQLRVLDIDGAYIARAEAHGFHHLTIEQLTNLKVTGVL